MRAVKEAMAVYRLNLAVCGKETAVEPVWTWDPDARVLRADRLPTAQDSRDPLGWARYDKRGRRTAQGTDRFTRPDDAALSCADETAANIMRRGDAPRKRFYLRYGDLPSGGRSVNHATGKKEAGVSVYAAKWEPVSGRWRLDGNAELGAALFSAAQGRPVYLVSGEEVGRGSDGEPVLKKAKIVAGMAYDGDGSFRVNNERQDRK